MENDIQVKAFYIYGNEINNIADSISRIQMVRYYELAPLFVDYYLRHYPQQN